MMMNDSTTLELDDYELSFKPLRYPIYFSSFLEKKKYTCYIL